MVDSFTIDVPGDQAGSFTPRVLRKRQCRLDGLDDMINQLVHRKGRGSARLSITCLTPLGQKCPTRGSLISPTRSTMLYWSGKTAPWMLSTRWFSLDTIWVKIRHEGGRVNNHTAYLAMGVDMDGAKHVLGDLGPRKRRRLIVGGRVRQPDQPRRRRHSHRGL